MQKPKARIDTYVRDHLAPAELWPEMDYSVLPELAQYPERMNAAVELLDKTATGPRADKPAIYFEDQIWTYADLLARTNRIAHVLVDELGVVPGTCVLLRSANHPMLIALYLAVLKVGGIAIPTMPVLRERELLTIIAKARVRLAVSDRRLADDLQKAKSDSETLERILYFNAEGPASLEALMEAKPESFKTVDTRADDIALIGFTSGSTGTPKGTVHFHRDILAVADTFIRHVVKIGPDEIVCGSPQIAFLYGLCVFVADTMRFGAACVLVDRATPEILAKTIQDYRATVCFTAPTGYQLMLEHLGKYDVSSLRVCVAGGEPLAPATFHAWEVATGVRLINGLGISELLHIFISAAGDDIKPGTIGKAVPGFKVRIVDEAMKDVAPGEVGEMIVKGPNGCRYLDDPERQRDYVRDGWNLSGDLCTIDEEGYISYIARTDDMIVSGGYNVSGPEVEAVLLEHPKVKECAVVGSPDHARGNIVKAFVVPQSHNDATVETVKALQDFVKAQIAPYKYPRAVEFVDELPLTATGKIQRGALRQREQDRFRR